MKSRVQFKFPTPNSWGSNSPPRGRLIIKFPPPRDGKVSNARGMPGGGECCSLDLTDTLSYRNKSAITFRIVKLIIVCLIDVFSIFIQSWSKVKMFHEFENKEFHFREKWALNAWRELVWCSVSLHLFNIYDDLKCFKPFIVAVYLPKNVVVCMI